MSTPEVSVVMGTRNAARYLDEALGSIRAGTFEDVEIVVVDCRSEDGSVAIAERHGARVIEQDGTGLFAGWNQGVDAARGRLVAFLDSDDTWVPGKLEAQVARLRDQPELDYVIGHARHFLEPGMPPPPGLRPEILDVSLPAPMPGTLLARRRVFDLIGPFRTDYAIASDVDWFARLKDAGLRYEVVPEALIHKRMHDSNLSLFRAETMNGEIVDLLRTSIRRQRGAG
jgi:glycosyltransferase involved in cell wall biosynthesis